MATTYKVSPEHFVQQQDIRHCNKCNAEIFWQFSQNKNKYYATDVKTKTCQNGQGFPYQAKVSGRNWFHSCVQPQAPAPTPQLVPQQPPLFEKTFNIAGIIDLFTKALQHLKHPKIRLATTSGQTVALALAGAKSKFQGQIHVTDGERYGMNKYFGRIDQAGNWIPANNQPPNVFQVLPEVVTLLGKLSDNPAEVAAAYGKLTGNCCFCNRPLFGEDQRSTDVGYGPTCAKHYNLPW